MDGVEVGYDVFWDSFEDTVIENVWSNGGDQYWQIDSSTAQDET